MKKGKQKTRIKIAPFAWSTVQQKALGDLLESMTNPSILAYADYTKPFRLHTDACGTGISVQFFISSMMEMTV